jgi:hypothetical protein
LFIEQFLIYINCFVLKHSKSTVFTRILVITTFWRLEKATFAILNIIMKIVRCNFIFKCIEAVKEFKNGLSFVILQNLTLLSLLAILIILHIRYTVRTIDLVLIDQQSVGKRSLHLMNTVNAKKRWTTIYWRVNKFLKESHVVTRIAKERASFLKINYS